MFHRNLDTFSFVICCQLLYYCGGYRIVGKYGNKKLNFATFVRLYVVNLIPCYKYCNLS